MAPQEDLRSQEPTKTLPERVGQLYYAHGLFCSSHPLPVIGFAIAVVLLCCYPLLNLPLPGNVPQQLSGNLSLQGYNSSRDVGEAQNPHWFTGHPLVYVQQVVVKTAVCPWTKDLVLSDAFRAPLAEVFKLIEVVHNYQHENSSKSLSHLCLHVEAVKMKSDKKLLLPEYNCLVLSPANLWQQNRERYQEDSNLLSTIFNYQNLQKGKISLAEMLFGMNMKDTGIKRYPLRTRQRVLQFAITIVLKDYDVQFLAGLRQKLMSLYPLHQASMATHGNDSAASDVQEILHVYYPGEFNLRELVPLTMTYFMLFLYMYFSVRKIELVKSKVGMAFSAVVTVLASLSMSVGLCFFFGLTLTLNGREIFPYLVVIVGLENVLVLTKSVVSTPTHLDVKIRVAQGLSREGWSITKNLLTEVTILTVGLFTFVPAIQEFCIFAVVGLISDFFLQMVFFSTVLAIDIRRMELSSDSHHHRIYHNPSTSPNRVLNQTPLRQFRSPTPGIPSSICSPSKIRNIVRSKSHPRLNGLSSGISLSANYPTNVVAPPFNSTPILVKLPKRLRLVHFWARTRIFQRAFMVCMVVWISVIVYNSGLVEHVFQVSSDPQTLAERDSPEIDSVMGVDENQDLNSYYYVPPKSLLNSGENVLSESDRAAILDNIADLKTLRSLIAAEGGDSAKTPAIGKQLKTDIDDLPRPSDPNDDLARLKHSGFDPWRRLSHHHWPAILSLYNTSVAGRYISILPAIRLSHAVAPELAQSLRNLEERAAQHFQWQALAAALDPLDFSDGETSKVSSQQTFLGSDVPFIPSSPMELFLTAVLCVISVVVLAYTMVVLYRCVCTRNYAEWRASWAGEHESGPDGITQVVMEAVPLILEGHQQEVECLSSDGNLVVSSCLGGQLRVWDSLSGEALATIDRKIYFSALQRSQCKAAHTSPDADLEDLPLSDYESGSPPSRGEAASDEPSQCLTYKTERSRWELPDMHSAININFSSQSGLRQELSENARPSVNINKNSFDFGIRYHDLFQEYEDFQMLDDMNIVELKRDSKSNDRTPDSTKLSLTNIGELPASDKSSATNIFSHPENVLNDSLEGRSSNTCDSVETMTRHRKPRRSWNDVSDVGFDIENNGRPTCLSGSLSTKRNISHKFDDFSVSSLCTSNVLSSSLTHSMENIGVSSFNLPENCDTLNVNTSDNYQSCFHGSTLSNVESSCSSDTNYSKGKPRTINSKNAQHSRCSVTVNNSPSEGSTTVRQDSHLSSGPLPCLNVERSRLSTSGLQVPPIWCLDCHENLVVLGCANGRLEFWEGSTGRFKCLFEDGSGVGVTAVKIIGNRVVVAKLSGAVDFLELESYSQGRPLDWGFTSYRRTHVRTGSAGSLTDWDSLVARDSVEEDIRCIRLNTTKAHQQPITVLDSEGGRVLTGSKDHTLKVFRLEDQLPLYTLHGHCGPISCLFIDRISPMMSGSGSQDGLLCVWDLLTGACMYSIQAHDGSVIALTYSASYVISLGSDERLCVWERFQGHLLNTIQVAHTYCSSMVMLTHNLLITSKQGSLVVWDVRTGDPVRVVKLGHSDRCVFVKQILLLRDSIACDYSNQLRIVRFPLVSDKCD